MNVSVLGLSNQKISLLIDSSIVVIIVYAKCLYLERMSLWFKILSFSTLHLPWIIFGDFNISGD